VLGATGKPGGDAPSGTFSQISAAYEHTCGLRTDGVVACSGANVEWKAPTLRFPFTGFFQPVDNLPTLNTMKAGTAVPIRFALGGDFGLAVFDVGFPLSEPVSCGNGMTPVADVEETASASSSSLSFNSSTRQYVYLWKSNKAWANTCRHWAEVHRRDSVPGRVQIHA
jgi:hypothetical protein